MNDPAPLLAETRDLCGEILAADDMGRARDEAVGRAVMGRVRVLLSSINSPAPPPCAICFPNLQTYCADHVPGICRG